MLLVKNDCMNKKKIFYKRQMYTETGLLKPKYTDWNVKV